jgi:hypothetical protein
VLYPNFASVSVKTTKSTSTHFRLQDQIQEYNMNHFLHLLFDLPQRSPLYTNAFALKFLANGRENSRHCALLCALQYVIDTQATSLAHHLCTILTNVGKKKKKEKISPEKRTYQGELSIPPSSPLAQTSATRSRSHPDAAIIH